MFAITRNITFQHIEELALSATRLCVIVLPCKHTPTECGNKILNIQIQQIVLRALWFAATRQNTLKFILNLSFYLPISTFTLTAITSLAIAIFTTQLTNNVIKRLNKNRLKKENDSKKNDESNNQLIIQQQHYENSPMLLPVLHGQPSYYKYIFGLTVSTGIILTSTYDAYFNTNIITITSGVLNTLSVTTTYIIKPIFTYYNTTTPTSTT
ncbi:hypothetical protein N9N03_01620 [Chlamydiia bacterium]|nr:hypothetical protein [Chlamydiia bacterium]